MRQRLFTQLSVIALLFFLGTTASTTAHADFNAAMKIYEAQRFDEARTAFEALAAIGDRESLFNLGVMHYRGESVTGDALRGYALMYLANKDYGAEHMGATVEKIHANLSPEQRQEAETLIETLSTTYDIRVVENRVFPVLLDDKDCVPELRPVKAVAPRYPRKELEMGHIGFSIAEYTISPQGYVRDLLIVRSHAKGFSKASAKAVKRYRYNPPEDGRPVYGHQNKFTYMIEASRGKASKIKSKTIKKTLAADLAAAEAGDVVAQFVYARSLRELKTFKESLVGMDLQYRDANQWFEKSARGGLPHAQFELGRNMLRGIGCEVDRESGLKWVKAAAVSGYSEAQHLLAREVAATARTDQNNLAVMGWLRNAAVSDYYPAKIHLAWELSTSATQHLRDANEALELLETESENYFDDVRILETQAVAWARLGDYKRAITLQKKAISIAEDLEWIIPDMQDRLGLYEHGEPWTGPYY